MVVYLARNVLVPICRFYMALLFISLYRFYKYYPFLWVNSLWTNDDIWRQRSGSTLAQVLACCLTAPSHYLNQFWLTISKVHWHSFEWILQEILQLSITKVSWTITSLNLLWNLPGANEFKILESPLKALQTRLLSQLYIFLAISFW